jgi:hypothetical protein
MRDIWIGMGMGLGANEAGYLRYQAVTVLIANGEA